MSEKKDVSTEEIFARAIQNHQQNKLQLANKFYNETLKQNPNRLGAYNNLGILHNQLGQYEKAKDFYKKIIEIQPYNADAYFNLGNTFKILRQPQEAISFYEYLEHAQVYELFKKLDIYVSLNKYGNLSNTNLEAISLEKAMII